MNNQDPVPTTTSSTNSTFCSNPTSSSSSTSSSSPFCMQDLIAALKTIENKIEKYDKIFNNIEEQKDQSIFTNTKSTSPHNSCDNHIICQNFTQQSFTHSQKQYHYRPKLIPPHIQQKQSPTNIIREDKFSIHLSPKIDTPTNTFDSTASPDTFKLPPSYNATSSTPDSLTTHIQTIVSQTLLQKHTSKPIISSMLPIDEIDNSVDIGIKLTLEKTFRQTPFPKHPTFRTYSIWRNAIKAAIKDVHTRDEFTIFAALKVCLKTPSVQIQYGNVHAKEDNMFPFTTFITQLDGYYRSAAGKAEYMQYVQRLTPRGTGLEIAQFYSSLLIDTKDNNDNATVISSLHYKLPISIQKKIYRIFNNTLPPFLSEYLEVIKDIINDPIIALIYPMPSHKENTTTDTTKKKSTFSKWNKKHTNNNSNSSTSTTTNTELVNTTTIPTPTTTSTNNNTQQKNKNYKNKKITVATTHALDEESSDTASINNASINLTTINALLYKPYHELENLLYIDVKIKNKIYIAMIDTGCQVDVLNTDIINELNIPVKKTTIKLATITTDLPEILVTKNKITLSIPNTNANKPIHYSNLFYITELKKEFQIILGLPFFLTFNPQYRHLKMNKVTFPMSKTLGINTIITDLVHIDDETTTPHNEQITDPVIEDLLIKYSSTFSLTGLQLPPRRTISHSIDLIPNAIVKKKPLFRLNEEKQILLKTQIEELLKAGLIKESSSHITANGFLVAKKPSGFRLCIDYVELNKLTIKNNYPIPRIEDLHDRLVGAKYFTKIDLQSGYYQIRMKESDIHKTAFITRYGSFEFLVMPFGLCNAPATFQQLMHQVLFEYLDKFVVVYLDDILIYSKTYELHLQHIEIVLNRLQLNTLYINKSKCEFCQESVTYLGFTVSAKGLHAEQNKVDAIKNWPTILKSTRDVRSFLGLSGYYRRFIKNYAAITTPLTELLKKDSCDNWSEQHTNAIEQIKQLLVDSPILALPDYTKEFAIYTDASSYAIGAQLIQMHDKRERPICFISRKLNSAESRYSTYDKEMLAILFAIEKWQVYLLGKHFIIYSDHKALQYLQTQFQLNGRQQRWLTTLSNFTFTISYISGKKNVVADALSRRPDYEEEKLIGVVSEIQTNDLTTRIQQEYMRYPKFHKTEYNPHTIFFKDGFYCIQPRITTQSIRIVIPRNSRKLINDIITENHSTNYNAHGGIHKTRHKVTQHFHWVGIATDIKNFIKNCVVCQQSKKPNQKTPGLLHPLPIPDFPWQVVSLDFVTSLPKTDNGNDALMVVVDKFSKYICLFPMKHTADTYQVAQLFLDNIVYRFGLPEALISDRDARFTSIFWQSIFRGMGTQLRMSSAHHPQSDGQTEIMNKTIIILLRSILKNHTDNWDKLLGAVQFAYNTSYNQSTKQIPHKIVYGRMPSTPYTLQCKELNKKIKKNPNILQEMQQTLNHTKKELIRASKNQKKYADKHRRAISYKVGNYVYLLSSELQHTPKLNFQYLGPFKVCHIINENAYIIYITHALGTYKTCNITSLKLFYGTPTDCYLLDEVIDIVDYTTEHDAICKYHQEHPQTRSKKTKPHLIIDNRITNFNIPLTEEEKQFDDLSESPNTPMEIEEIISTLRQIEQHTPSPPSKKSISPSSSNLQLKQLTTVIDEHVAKTPSSTPEIRPSTGSPETVQKTTLLTPVQRPSTRKQSIKDKSEQVKKTPLPTPVIVTDPTSPETVQKTTLDTPGTWQSTKKPYIIEKSETAQKTTRPTTGITTRSHKPVTGQKTSASIPVTESITPPSTTKQIIKPHDTSLKENMLKKQIQQKKIINITNSPSTSLKDHFPELRKITIAEKPTTRSSTLSPNKIIKLKQEKDIKSLSKPLSTTKKIPIVQKVVQSKKIISPKDTVTSSSPKRKKSPIIKKIILPPLEKVVTRSFSQKKKETETPIGETKNPTTSSKKDIIAKKNPFLSKKHKRSIESLEELFKTKQEKSPIHSNELEVEISASSSSPSQSSNELQLIQQHKKLRINVININDITTQQLIRTLAEHINSYRIATPNARSIFQYISDKELYELYRQRIQQHRFCNHIGLKQIKDKDPDERPV